MARSYPDRVVPGGVMKGAHVRVLRGYIDADLAAAGTSYPWTWANWSAAQDGQQPVRAAYFTEMRAAIQRLWDVKSRGPLPNWTQEAPQAPSGGQPGSLIRATHVTDLRNWLNLYENNHSPLSQGVNSYGYDPSVPNGPIVTKKSGDDWTGDARMLVNFPPSAAPAPWVRVTIKGRFDPAHGGHTINFLPPDFSDPMKPHVGDYRLFQYALKQYRDLGMPVLAVFPREFYYPFPTPDVTSGAYQAAFAQRVKEFVVHMLDDANGPVDLSGLVIWNEPNNPGGGALDAVPFARLLDSCRATFAADPRFATAMPVIYPGGLLLGTQGTAEEEITKIVTYVGDMERHFPPDGPTPLPWAAINLHCYHARGTMPGGDDTVLHTLLARVQEQQRDNGDFGGIIFGEWGVNRLDTQAPARLSELYGEIIQSGYPGAERVPVELMLYFSHYRNQDAGGDFGFRWSTNPGTLTTPVTFAGPSGPVVMELTYYRVDPYSSDGDGQLTKATRNRYATINHGATI